MRVKSVGNVLTVKAVSGTYVTLLGWTFTDEAAAGQQSDLLGFAIFRTEVREGNVEEQYWLPGIKRFRHKDEGLPPGTPVSTAEHPVQSFQWGDYTVKSGRTYIYKVVPVRGKPKLIQLDEASSESVEVITEFEGSLPTDSDASAIRHDVFFNRGVIGSQAYSRKFGNAEPDPDEPASPEMVWLSRGLFEALQKFIGLARSERFGLRAAFYEFKYQPVANAFAKALEAGADVKIVFDDESDYKTENRATISAAGLDQAGAVIPRTVTAGIRHNKFIVLLENGNPVAVWTGSTNISAGGIFGHSNVGHIVWDTDIAASYLKYWENLARNLTPTKLRAPNRALSPLPAGGPLPNSVTPLFSARDNDNDNTTLEWYAQRMAEAREMICFTVAFNLDEVFANILSEQNDILRYVVKDDDLGDSETVGHDRDVLFAAGGYFKEGALANFLRERANPLNTNRYIHTKVLLIDPLSADPLVISGSGNFSRPSQRLNDENMLVVRGDTRLADIFLGEFMRIFDHHYARYIVSKLQAAGTSNADTGYLKESTSEWLPSHFDNRSYKAKRRRLFSQ